MVNCLAASNKSVENSQLNKLGVLFFFSKNTREASAVNDSSLVSLEISGL